MRFATAFILGVGLTILCAGVILSCQPASVTPAQADPVDLRAPATPADARLVPQVWRAADGTLSPVLVEWTGQTSPLYRDTLRKEDCALTSDREFARCIPRRLVGQTLTPQQAAEWVSFARGDAP